MVNWGGDRVNWVTTDQIDSEAPNGLMKFNRVGRFGRRCDFYNS